MIFIYLVVNFPTVLKISKYIKYCLFLIAIFFSIVTFLDKVASNVIIRPGLIINDSVYGSMYYVYGVYIVLYFILGYYFLFRQLFRAKGIERIKTSYLLSAFVIATVFGLFTNLIYPIFVTRGIESNEGILSPYGPLATIIIALLTTYSIVRYRFMDIKVVIRKGFIHFISIAIVLFIYLYLLIFSQKYLVDKYNWNSQTSIIILVLVIALTIEPLRRFLFKVVDKVLYSRRKNMRDEAQKLRLAISSSLQFEQLIQKVQISLKSLLEVGEVNFIWYNQKSGNLESYFSDNKKISWPPTDALFHYLKEHPEPLVAEEISYIREDANEAEAKLLGEIEGKLKKLNVGLVWPIGERGELIGAFLLGQKTRKDAFTSDNVDYLANMQFPMTSAIANALLYKQAVERIGKLK